MQPDDQQRIMGYFIEEAKEHLDTIEQGLLHLQNTIDDTETMNGLFRAAHSVKGGAAMLGLHSIQKISHRLEDYFKQLKENPIQVDQQLESLFLGGFDGLHKLLDFIQEPFGLTKEKEALVMQEAEPIFEALEAHLNSLIASGAPAGTATVAMERAFSTEVPARLKEMLQLLKQPETNVGREQLVDICAGLAASGDQFDLTNWCAVIKAAEQAIANPDNSYRVLAPVLIKEIKQAQELVLAGRSAEIVVSSSLQALLPVVAPEPELTTMDGFDDLLGDLDVSTSDNLDLDFDLSAIADSPADSAGDDFDLLDLGVAASGMEAELMPRNRDRETATQKNADYGGPEVGMAELNSLADLFEGESPELDLMWDEEEIIPEAASDFMDAFATDTSDSDDFSDLLFETSANKPTPSNEDDLIELFGDGLLDGNEEAAAPVASGDTDLETAELFGSLDLDTLDGLDGLSELDDLNGLDDLDNLDASSLDTDKLEDASVSDSADADLMSDLDFLGDLEQLTDTDQGQLDDLDFGDDLNADLDDSLLNLSSSTTDDQGSNAEAMAGLDDFQAAFNFDVEQAAIAEAALDAANLNADLDLIAALDLETDEGGEDFNFPAEALTPLEIPGATDELVDLNQLADLPDFLNTAMLDVDGLDDALGTDESADMDFADLEDGLGDLGELTDLAESVSSEDNLAAIADEIEIADQVEITDDVEFSDEFSTELAADLTPIAGEADAFLVVDDVQMDLTADAFADVPATVSVPTDGQAIADPWDEFFVEEGAAAPSQAIASDDFFDLATAGEEKSLGAVVDQLDDLGGLDIGGIPTNLQMPDEEVAVATAIPEEPAAELPLRHAFDETLVEEIPFDALTNLDLDAAINADADLETGLAVDQSVDQSIDHDLGMDLESDLGLDLSGDFVDGLGDDFSLGDDAAALTDSELSGDLADFSVSAAAADDTGLAGVDLDMDLDMGLDMEGLDMDLFASSDTSTSDLGDAQTDVGNGLGESLEDSLDFGADLAGDLDHLFDEAETSDDEAIAEIGDFGAATDADMADLDLSDFGELEQVTAADSFGDELDSLNFGDELSDSSSSDDLALGDLDLDLGGESSMELTDSFNLDDELDAFTSSESPAESGGLDDMGLDSMDDMDELLGIDGDAFADLGDLTPEAPVATVEDAADVGDFDDLDALLEDMPVVDAAAPGVDDFSELDALLEDVSDSGPSTPAVAPILNQDFDELDALLGDFEAPAAPAKPAPSPAPVANDFEDEFADLTDLLTSAEKTIGPSSVAKPAVGQVRPKQALIEQSMRVPVKQLDNLGNLVGELVVNRNSLEQSGERLRQFLDNLLYQVQQLSDVGQRMRDLYERSLLESALLANRQSYQSGGSAASAHAAQGHSSGNNFDALEMDRFTGFHTLSQEMIELIVRVRESASDIEFIVDETDQVTRNFRQVTTQLQEGLTRSRMLPFIQTADKMPRGVRDNAIKYGKQVELLIEGKDTLIDKMILDRLSSPLNHLVNNALFHGIEKPDVRKAAGKNPMGKITVRAFYQGNQTVISVSDDGGGIDPDRIKRKAVQKGLRTPAQAEAMSRFDVYDLLFEPGFSGADEVTDIAGRGVGMDVVRTEIMNIRGTVSIDSTVGKGTTFTIRLPLTLSISKALCCISNRARIAFPIDGVEDTLEVPRDRIQTSEDGQSCFFWRDALLPFQSLSELLRHNRFLGRGSVYGGSQEDDIVSIVVLRSGNSYLAVQVDQIDGEREIVIKQLEGPVPKPPGIAGATVLGDGRIMPIADVLELIDLSIGRTRRDMGWSAEPPVVEEVEAATETTVLIVDDSITVRELLSMTFNKAGYRVEQARDGQDAWEKLRSGLPCSLVFCDIEMPRMDGLELLSRMQKDPNLSKLPIAMLTSRGADRHRQMAVQLGARGYFTKPYLEEQLLEAAQRMLKGEVLVGLKTEG